MEKIKYDSTVDTLKHIKRVQDLLSDAAMEILRRGKAHDLSKLGPNEKPLFDEETPKLKNIVYGSDEYQESLNRLKPALEHHYANNSHHPQFYENGIDDYDLFDLIEMFFDWKAASERTSNGDIKKSIEHNGKRFNMSPQVMKIFHNTVNNIWNNEKGT